MARVARVESALRQMERRLDTGVPETGIVELDRIGDAIGQLGKALRENQARRETLEGRLSGLAFAIGRCHQPGRSLVGGLLPPERAQAADCSACARTSQRVFPRSCRRATGWGAPLREPGSSAACARPGRGCRALRVECLLRQNARRGCGIRTWAMQKPQSGPGAEASRSRTAHSSQRSLWRQNPWSRRCTADEHARVREALARNA